jgi:hypothetical protein
MNLGVGWSAAPRGAGKKEFWGASWWTLMLSTGESRAMSSRKMQNFMS